MEREDVKPVGWLAGKPESEYRHSLYREMTLAKHRYTLRKMRREGKSEPEIAQLSEKQRQEAASIKAPARVEVVAEALPSVAIKRDCVKYGSFMSGSRLERVFIFDASAKKYRYYRSKEESKDVAEKSMNLARGEYEIQDKNYQGPDGKWDDPSGTKNYRLSMKFEERGKRPIFIYSASLEDLHALKNYGRYCVKTKAGPMPADFDQLLALLYFGLSTHVWGKFKQLYETVGARSAKNSSLVTRLRDGARLLRRHEDTVIIAWASGITGAIRKARPQSTMRIKALLWSLYRSKDMTEGLIVDSATRIVREYRRHKQKNLGMASDEIVEMASRPSKGFSANAGFTISDKILPYTTGKVAIPREHVGFCKFEFPGRSCPETASCMKVDSGASRLVMETGDHRKVLGDFFMGDVSSMVLNDQKEGDARKWLRINGRRIRKPESFTDAMNEKSGQTIYVDPASQFLAPSIDSYLTKKSLFEIKIYLARVQKLDEIIKVLKTPDIAFRVKIWAGDKFWTSTQFSRPRMKMNGGQCEFKQTYRIRVDPAMMDAVTVSLSVCPIEKGMLPDILESLKREMSLGFSRIRLSNIAEQKKVLWIPLNNDFYPDKPFAKAEDPMISINYKLVQNLPGNFPEAPMCGKQYTIGDMVYYNEEVKLEYPATQAEFDLLQRADIKFNPARVGTAGTPLRPPATEDEWKMAKLEDGPFKKEGLVIENLLRIQHKVPFMFRMPGDKESFAECHLPGNYAKLSKIYKPGDIVKDLEGLDAKQICILRGLDKNENCYLTLADQVEAEGNVVKKKLGEVFSTTEEGVSVFDKGQYYPQQMVPRYIDHEWTLNIAFDLEENRVQFLKALKDGIRDYWYKQKAGNIGEKLSKDDIKLPVAGELQVYVTEARNLGMDLFRKKIGSTSGARMSTDKIQVRLGFRAPKSLADLFTSVFVDDTLIESLEANLKKDDIFLEHTVDNNPTWRTPTSPAGEMRSMGRLAHLPKSNALLTVTVCIPYTENGAEQLYVFGSAEIPLMHLLNEQSPTNYYWLLLQNDVDGNLPQIKVWTMFHPEDRTLPSIYPGDPPKSYAAQLLLAAEKEASIVDSYKQPVNLGLYNPNYMRVEQDFLRNFLEGKGQPEDEKIVNNMLLSKIDPKKPSFEAWEYKLINAYRFLRQQSRANIFSSMSHYLWDSYIIKLMMNVTKTRTLAQAGPAEAARVEASIGSQLQKVHGSLLKLDRIRFWKEAGSWKYTDIIALCKLGLPKELRPTIWSELFGLSGARNPGFEDIKYIKYGEFVSKSMNMDSIVYQQMEHDILDITLTNITQPSDAILLHNERAGVLKIAKAYHAWCQEENAKPDDRGKPRQSFYGYFKGIMHLIQKVWQLFPEVEAFWCIVGFAKALPYIFETRDIMVGKLSWSHKLLVLAISTVIEKQYPEIYKAVLRHGLPIEYYISDKLFTMLSTVYPTETLLRLYDIIALEAASKEPIRAMWVLLTGCILLFVLNETYIKAARAADEIELLINNTGINNLNTQKIVEQTYAISSKLFSTYNPGWERFLAVLIKKEDSVMGMEQAWTNKAIALDTRYTKVKNLNGEVSTLLEGIRTLGQEEVKGGPAPYSRDSSWVNNFVGKFREYYGEYASKEIPDHVFLYMYKCCNARPEGTGIRVIYGDSDKQTVDISPNGMIDQMVEFRGNPKATTLQIVVPEVGCCEIDLSNYEFDMPITMDKALCQVMPVAGVSHETAKHRGQSPQPFISLVLLIVTRAEGHVDDVYKYIKQSMMYESKIVFQEPNEALRRQMTSTVEQTKARIVKQFHDAGLQSVYMPTVKTTTISPDAGTAENDRLALKHLFALVKSRGASKYVSTLVESDMGVEDITKKAFDVFTKYYSGRLPLKRVIVSLIASASLTVYDKLSCYYDIYTALPGQEGNSFLLEDITELIQLLYELHLIYIQPEYIPHLVEQVMTNGGINRITNAYVLAAGVDTTEVLQNMHLRGGAKDEDAVRVTNNVQEAFAHYWELWGHKQVFASDPHSFCGSLNTVLGGYKRRPKKGGPYRLVICYKHKGQSFYKELDYDASEKLILTATTADERRTLLMANRNNLSFVGERIKMTKDEFISRINKLPLLTELMRLHASLKSELTVKHMANLTVSLVHERKKVAVITFRPGAAAQRDEFETPQVQGATPSSEKPTYKYDGGVLNIQLQLAYREDLLAEVKTRILDSIQGILNDIMTNDPRAEIPEALNPAKYLNHALQFFDQKGPLDDYERLDKHTGGDIALTAREIDQHKKQVDLRRVFAFHMHGDYSLEWVQCVELTGKGSEFTVRTVLFPSVVQEIQRPFLLLDKK